MNQGNITQGQGSVGSSQGGTSNALGGNSTITSWASTQEQDPGTWLWIPRSNPNLYVFDPIILWKKHFGVVSPCFMNGRDYSSSWDCGSLYNWIGTFYDQDNKVVHFSGVSSGSVVSFRFTTLPDTDELQIPTFTLAWWDWWNFGLIASISLSENPGEFIEWSLCYRERAHSSSTRTSFLTPHGYRLFVSKYPDSSMNYCVLEANKEYYYNMKFLKDYSHLNFQLHGDGVIWWHILEEVISSNESGIPGRSTDSLCSPTPSNVSVIGVNAQGWFPFNSPGLRIDWASSNTMAYKFVFGLENRTNGGIAYVDGNAGTGRKDISISTCPWVYDVPTECRSSGRNSGVISWSTDANQSGCKLVPGASYYLNVRPYHTGSYVGYAITNQ
jgi:hypothetical protein